MTDGFRTRDFAESDTERVKELHETAMRDVGGFVEGVSDTDLDTIESTYQDNGAFLVGVFQEQIVAMGGIRPIDGHLKELLPETESTAELKRLRVDPSFQRRGFGQRVLDRLERRAEELGFSELALDTTASQQGAQEFFEANGFEMTLEKEIETFDAPFTLLVYRRPIVDT